MSVEGASFQLDDVSLSFGDSTALADITCTIQAGERIALVGPSGAGKTSILRLLNNTVSPTRGRVSFDGQDLALLTPDALRRVRSEIGFIYQSLDLIPNLRTLQNVLVGRFGRLGFFSSLRYLLFPPKASVLEVYELLEQVGIGEKLYQIVHRLSGGQQQRVAIARTLFQQPRAILADEPVSSVDPARARDTLELLLSIARARGLTLCMSIHDVDLAKEFFPRLIGLRRGQIVFDGPPEHLDDDVYRALYRLEQRELLEEAAKSVKK